MIVVANLKVDGFHGLQLRVHHPSYRDLTHCDLPGCSLPLLIVDDDSVVEAVRMANEVAADLEEDLQTHLTCHSDEVGEGQSP